MTTPGFFAKTGYYIFIFVSPVLIWVAGAGFGAPDPAQAEDQFLLFEYQ